MGTLKPNCPVYGGVLPGSQNKYVISHAPLSLKSTVTRNMFVRAKANP